MARRPDLGIGGWLALGFGAAAILLAGVVALAVFQLGRIADAERHLSAEAAPRAAAAVRAEADALRVGIEARNHALEGSQASLAAYGATRARYGEALEALGGLAAGEADGDAYERAAPLLAAFREAADGLVARVGRVPEAELLASEAELAARRVAAVGALRAYAEVQERRAREASAAIRALHARTARLLVAATALVLGLLGLTAALVVRGVRRPALELVSAARRLGAGDYAAAAALAPPPGGAAARRSELAVLGAAFGRMALDLQDREARILAQNEELQVQQEELQGQNEELQAQQEELQAQNEELHAQQEELAAQAEDLRGRDERLRESEARYRHLFEHLSEGFALHEMLWDAHGEPADYRFIEVNPAFEALTGLSRERTVGHTVKELIPALEPEWLARYGEVARTGRPVRFEGFSAALGRHYEVVAFRPEAGQFATLFFDVTERREAEDALRASDRRKDEFLAVLSHELRNPLAPIVSGLQVVEAAEPASAAAARAREIIRRQVGHLVRLVDDLLDVTRISRGKVHLRRARVALGGIVRDAAEDCAATLAERGVALEVDAPAEGPWVDADPARLAQVAGNLLQNAAKFTPAGGRVSVAVREEGGRAVLRVRDTGVGIAPEVLPKLFQPFMQAERTLARTGGGLGLGLALVKGLVELHGGEVSVASGGEGKGAEFTVELPLVARTAPAAEARRRAAGPRRRVLVVEDNADAAETLADLLRLEGHAVAVAETGVEGLRRVAEFRPDAILCDLGLPGIDGYEFARRLRADGATARTFLVALTGYALPEDLRRTREAGFDAHLTKPALPEEIQEVLARVPGERIAGP